MTTPIETATAPFVTYQDCWEMDEPHVFYTEASDLGLPVGKFPKFIETDMGNGQPFSFNKYGGDIITYYQVFGCLTLRVFND